MLLTVLLTTLVKAGETLPDEVRFADDEPDQDMQQRFPAPMMDAGELEQLYLQSPVEVGTSPASGLRAVRGEEPYAEEVRNQERQRLESLSSQPPPTAQEQPVLPPVPAGVPIRQL